jgi:hypothetical protein
MLLKNIIVSYLLILLLLTIAGSSLAQTRKDTLFFNNNEILIGELKQVSRGVVSFDSDGVGLISIKAYKIRSIHTTIGTLRIETTAKQWLYGTLVPAKSNDSIYVDDGEHRVMLARDEISSITSFRRHFFNQLSGKVSAGLSFSHSSSIGQLNVNADIVHTSRFFRLFKRSGECSAQFLSLYQKFKLV